MYKIVPLSGVRSLAPDRVTNKWSASLYKKEALKLSKQRRPLYTWIYFCLYFIVFSYFYSTTSILKSLHLLDSLTSGYLQANLHDPLKCISQYHISQPHTPSSRVSLSPATPLHSIHPQPLPFTSQTVLLLPCRRLPRSNDVLTLHATTFSFPCLPENPLFSHTP